MYILLCVNETKKQTHIISNLIYQKQLYKYYTSVIEDFKLHQN